ncbi:MAG: hypothetical protein AAFR26_21965 [Cyanobacteria bacterium J06626_4]
MATLLELLRVYSMAQSLNPQAFDKTGRADERAIFGYVRTADSAHPK